MFETRNVRLVLTLFQPFLTTKQAQTKFFFRFTVSLQCKNITVDIHTRLFEYRVKFLFLIICKEKKRPQQQQYTQWPHIFVDNQDKFTTAENDFAHKQN